MTSNKQESHAIAKVTARCAIAMDALDNFECPWLRPCQLLSKLLMGFWCDGLYQSAYKIRSL